MMRTLEEYLQETELEDTIIITVRGGVVESVTRNDGEEEEVNSIIIDYDDLEVNCCPMCGGMFIDEFICPDCGIDWR